MTIYYLHKSSENWTRQRGEIFVRDPNLKFKLPKIENFKRYIYLKSAFSKSLKITFKVVISHLLHILTINQKTGVDPF